MEVDPQTLRRVWWKGAITAALKGIPQGLMLGALAGVLMFGTIAAMLAIGGPVAGIGLVIAKGMGSFVYGSSAINAIAGLSPAAALPLLTSWHALSLVTIAPFNAVLASVGNFLSGGKMACNAYKQDIEHKMNETRISQIESREMALEKCVTPPHVQRILAQGRAANFVDAVEQRSAQPGSPTLH